MRLTHRTQVLLDDRRHHLLRSRSEATGRSVGALVREAIDLAFSDTDTRERVETAKREAALASFLAAEPAPMGDLEAELDGLYERDL